MTESKTKDNKSMGKIERKEVGDLGRLYVRGILILTILGNRTSL